jgi:CDP-diacylglycerol--glycerol-3-phosphate 3-phosphatidyltransferase
MNLPNKLTMLRVILVPFFMFFIMFPTSFETTDRSMFFHILAAVIFIIAAFTDMLDGKIARKRNLVTNFGKFMDPIADKFMVFGALLSFIAAFPEFRNVLVWVTAIILLRELAVTSMRLVAQNADGIVIAASWLGKVKTASQCISIVLILIEPYLFKDIAVFSEYRVLSWISIAVMTFFAIYSGIDYISAYWKYMKPEGKNS